LCQRVSDGVVRHLAGSAALENPEIAKLPKVMRRGRNAHPQYVSDVADTEFLAFPERVQDLEPSFVGQSAEDDPSVLQLILVGEISSKTTHHVPLEAGDASALRGAQ
jgi:hypothetical protein